MTRARWRILEFLAILVTAAGAWASGPDASPAAPDGIIVHRDEQQGTITVIVPTEGGRLDWDDVSRGLAVAGRFNGQALSPEVGDHPINLADPLTRLTLRGVSAAVPDVEMRVIEHPSGGELALRIRLDRADARRKVRRLKAEIREQFPATEGNSGLRLDDDWDEGAAGQPLIVLVHGYAGDRDSLEGLREALAKRGLACATFAYPNDGPLAASAELLAEELVRFQEEHPGRRIAFIAHSMGGLLVRAVIESPEYGSFPVSRLIMICPPNHGSPWAELPGGLECFEYVREDQREPLSEAFAASISDGLNEARHDLQPGSPFLRRLNARPRNPTVRYTILLGTAAPFTAGEVARIHEQCARRLSQSRTGRFVKPRVDSFFGELDDVAHGRGDGVVSVESGELGGVEDVLSLPMDHWTVTGEEFTSPIQQRLLAAILDRLKPSGQRP